MRTVWVLGDQLNRRIGALAEATPGDTTILMVEGAAMLRTRRYHRQRLHLVMTAMWSFLRRRTELLQRNARMARQYHTLGRLSDIDEVEARATEVINALERGAL